MKACHALPFYFSVLGPRSEVVVLFWKNRRGKDGNRGGNRRVAGFMRCVNVHPFLADFFCSVNGV